MNSSLLLRKLPLSVLLLTTLFALPLVFVVGSLANMQIDLWSHLLATVLPEYVVNSMLLLLGTAVGAGLVGIPSAWFVSTRDFPGRNLCCWLLVLPFAIPPYIAAYVYGNLIGPASFLTELGLTPPPLHSLTGAILLLSFMLYPYVHIMARMSFSQNCIASMEASRTLGKKSWQSFTQVALPMSRPFIATGLALVMIEGVSDFGTVQYLGVPTLTTGLYRAWSGLYDYAAAVQISLLLLTLLAIPLIFERLSRRSAKYSFSGEIKKRRAINSPLKLVGVWLVCLIPPLFGFLIPLFALIRWALLSSATSDDSFWQHASNSFTVAAATAVLVTLCGFFFAYARRVRPTPLVRAAVGTSTLGYCLPGLVVAALIIIPIGLFDHALADFLEAWFDVDTGLLLSGGLAVLIYAYAVRFLLPSVGILSSGLSRIRSVLEESTLILAKGSRKTLIKDLYLPMLTSSFCASVIIVFAEVMKELPATLMLRPVDFDTLSVHLYHLASEERIVEGAAGSLVIVLICSLPVLFLNLAFPRDQETAEETAQYDPAYA